MSKKTIFAIIVIVIFVIAGYFLFTRTAAAPTPIPNINTTQTTDATTGSTAQVASLITYTDTGFSPKNITVKAGDTVRFVNSSSHGMWVASSQHPTHTQYDGTSTSQHCASGANTSDVFDECAAVDPGTVYSFTFTKAGTFTFHNHVRASDTGSVSVTK